jgi:fibronectin type 3 domain-containing protein
VTSSQVTLGWTASTSSGVAVYNVYRADSPGGPYTLKNSSLGLTFTDATVVHGHIYYYVVTTVGALGVESVNSNEVSATP